MSVVCLEVNKIKDGIGSITKESKQISKSYEEVVNAYLDTINKTNEDLRSVTKRGLELNEYLLDCFYSINKDNYTYFFDEFKSLNKSLLKLFLLLNKENEFRTAIKGSLLSFKDMLDDLKETEYDILNFRIKLQEDNEFNSLIDTLNDIL